MMDGRRLVNQDPEAVGASLKEVVITHGLSRLEAATDTHVVTVEEPSIWAGVLDDRDPMELITTVREIDL